MISFTGRKFDGAGKVRNWWSPEVNELFKEKAQCFVDQFNGYELPGIGENVTILLFVYSDPMYQCSHTLQNHYFKAVEKTTFSGETQLQNSERKSTIGTIIEAFKADNEVYCLQINGNFAFCL